MEITSKTELCICEYTFQTDAIIRQRRKPNNQVESILHKEWILWSNFIMSDPPQSHGITFSLQIIPAGMKLESQCMRRGYGSRLPDFSWD